MGVIGDLLGILLDVFSMICNVYSLVVIVACLITWVNPDPYNPIVRILRGLTDPVLQRIRRVFPFLVVSGFDLSPVVLLIVIRVIERLVYRLVGALIA